MNKVRSDTTDEEDETVDETVKEDENGTTNCVKITPNINETDTESLAKVRLENNDNGEDTSTVISTISDDISEVRGLRTMDINDWLTDERAQEVI